MCESAHMLKDERENAFTTVEAEEGRNDSVEEEEGRNDSVEAEEGYATVEEDEGRATVEEEEVKSNKLLQALGPVIRAGWKYPHTSTSELLVFHFTLHFYIIIEI